jgi:hypothetical protein
MNTLNLNDAELSILFQLLVSVNDDKIDSVELSIFLNLLDKVRHELYKLKGYGPHINMYARPIPERIQQKISKELN